MYIYIYIYALIHVHVTFGLTLPQLKTLFSADSYFGLCRTTKNSTISKPQTQRSSPIQGLALFEPLLQRRQGELVRMELQTEHLAADGYRLIKMDLDQ